VDLEFGETGDGGVVGVEGDKFGLVVDGGGGDEEVEGPGIVAVVAAGLAEAGGVAPEPGGVDRRGRVANWASMRGRSSWVAWRRTSKATGSQRQAPASRIQA
jgi:hypothetical protein